MLKKCLWEWKKVNEGKWCWIDWLLRSKDTLLKSNSVWSTIQRDFHEKPRSFLYILIASSKCGQHIETSWNIELKCANDFETVTGPWLTVKIKMIYYLWATMFWWVESNVLGLLLPIFKRSKLYVWFRGLRLDWNIISNRLSYLLLSVSINCLPFSINKRP